MVKEDFVEKANPKTRKAFQLERHVRRDGGGREEPRKGR